MRRDSVKRWLPIALIVLMIGCIVYFRWYEYLSFAALQAHHQQLTQWTKEHYWLSVCAYMLIYIIAVATSVPGATILTITGGYLFGIFPGLIYIVMSATIGACLIFLAVETAFGKWLALRAKGWLKRTEEGFQENAFNYTLFLRLVLVLPFWVVNIIPALLDVRLRVFALATFIGIIPGSLVYASVGSGLGSVLQVGQTPNLQIIFQPRLLIPILALALLSLVPVVYKKLKRKTP